MAGCTNNMMRCEMEQEIESLRQQLAECQTESANWFRKYMEENDALAESQAREKVLRDALNAVELEFYQYTEGFTILWGEIDAALALPSDSTVLDSAIRQAKREALLEAAEAFNCEPSGPVPAYPQYYSTHIMGVLRRMADELG